MAYRPFNKSRHPMGPLPTPFKAGKVKDYACTILELTNFTCHWPCWEGKYDAWVSKYCGCPTHRETPYCKEHSKKAYN